MSKPRDIADSAATINFIDTVTSNVQDQLDNLDPVPTNIAGGSAGTIPYQSAADTTAMLAVGTAGQVLQTNGAAAPTWVTPAGGAMVLLSTVTASNSGTVDIETTFDSTYDVYVLIASGVVNATDGQTINLRMKLNGAYVTSSTYSYHVNNSGRGSAAYVGAAGSDVAQVTFLPAVGNNSQLSSNLVFHIYNPSSTLLRKTITWKGQYAHLYDSSGWAINMTTAASSVLTGIRLYAGSGNISKGTFRLYGIVNS